MLRFWRNPEFVRHAWAELRVQRVVIITAVEALVIFLFWLSNKSSSPQSMQWQDYFESLTNLQFIGLAIWVCYSCGQAIARERLMKTYDFLITTRLSATELIVGKLLGEPLLGYYAILVSIPFSFWVGVRAGNSFSSLFGIYVVLMVMGLVFGLMSLWVSMLVETISAGVLALIAAFVTLFFQSFQSSAIRGFAALSPAATVASLSASSFAFESSGGWRYKQATLFGTTVPYFVCFLLIYCILGCFLFLMLRRNLKRDPQSMKMLTRPQALSMVLFFGLLFYAFYDPSSFHEFAKFRSAPADFYVEAATFSTLLIYVLGLLTLSPLDACKHWWRMQKDTARLLDSDGPASMWLLIASGCTFLMLVVAAWCLRGRGIWTGFYIKTAGIEFALIAIFAIRDILFLQWCLLTRMKLALVKGIVYLGLYYFASSIIIMAARQSSLEAMRFAVGVLTPFSPAAVFNLGSWSGVSTGVMVGIPLQFGIIILLWVAIRARLIRPVKLPIAQTA